MNVHLQIELAAHIPALLNPPPKADHLTQTIVQQYQIFLQTADFSAFVQNLSPLAWHLGEDALLGSDGETYDPQELALWQVNIDPQIHRERHPFEPTNPAIFTVTPHKIVRPFMRMMKPYFQLSQEQEEAKQEVSQAYAVLKQRGPLPRLPTEDYIRIRHQELLQMKESLRTSPLQDALTNKVRAWHQTFIKENKRLQDTIDADRSLFDSTKVDESRQALHIAALQNLVPLLQSLCEDALLGSDGNTYDPKQLQLYLALQPSPVSFTVEPHPVVRRVAHFLRSYYTDPIQEGKRTLIAEGFEALKKQGLLPALPTSEYIRMKAELDRLAALRLAALKAAASGNPEAAKQHRERLAKETQNFRRGACANMAAAAAALDTWAADIQKQIEAVEKENTRVHKESLKEMVDIAGEVKTGRDDLVHLHGALQTFRGLMQKTRAEVGRLNQMTDETYAIISRQASRSNLEFCKAVGWIVGCSVATHCLGFSNIKIGPMPGGAAGRWSTKF